MTIRETWQRSKFVWGQTDCVMAFCNYIRDKTGTDPARPWRGTYDDEAGAVAIYSQYGGVYGLVSYGMAMARFQPCQVYDQAPVVAIVAGREIAGISFGSRVGFMMEKRGMIEVRAAILGAWRI